MASSICSIAAHETKTLCTSETNASLAVSQQVSKKGSKFIPNESITNPTFEVEDAYGISKQEDLQPMPTVCMVTCDMFSSQVKMGDDHINSSSTHKMKGV
jgi:hypothetical protein